VNKCVKHLKANAEASTTLASGGDICKANLFVATLSNDWVMFGIMGSDESLELSSLVPNEGDGEGGGVVDPPETVCSRPLSRPWK
jgi:hypothetical protein